MAPSIDSEMLRDDGLRGFWIRHGLALFTTLWIGTVAAGGGVSWTIYSGLQTLSAEVGLVAQRADTNSGDIEDNLKEIQANSAGVDVLTLDRATTTATLANLVRADAQLLQSLEELKAMFAEYADSTAAVDREDKDAARISELQILIRLDEAELRRIQRITRGNAARDATQLEIEAEADVIESLAEKREELRNLRGF